ncbi:hypothetical protein [Rubrivivax sp. A210]|uniref:hypothetical protein n=1 Tax=Rubrivivax sp. A210 TaxID=2772301 RepID=UPI0019188BEB|nr:hypothetical protein [Rubrivivax sp. A210]
MPSEPARYRPISPRRRLLILALAVATAVSIVLLLVGEPGGARLAQRPPPPAGPALCSEGQSSGCVGGLARVIVPAPAASR